MTPAGPRTAQHPGTGAGHPGRAGPHRRPDRRTAVHQHPHRPLPPGPHPGQDWLPPPRRPDPPGPQHGPGLAAPGRPVRRGPRRLWVVVPRPPPHRKGVNGLCRLRRFRGILSGAVCVGSNPTGGHYWWALLGAALRRFRTILRIKDRERERSDLRRYGTAVTASPPCASRDYCLADVDSARNPAQQQPATRTAIVGRRPTCG